MLGQFETYVESKTFAEVQATWVLIRSLNFFKASTALRNVLWKHCKISLAYSVLNDRNPTYILELASWYYNALRYPDGTLEKGAKVAMDKIALYFYRTRQSAMIGSLPSHENGLEAVLRSDISLHHAKSKGWHSARRIEAEQERLP